MLKKIITFIATTAITLAGLGALPASATGFTPNTDSNVTKRSWSAGLPENGQFTVPANTNSLSIGKRWLFNGTKAADITSKTITVEWSLTKPDGSVIGSSTSNNQGMYASSSGTLSDNQGAYVEAYSSGSPSFALNGASGVTYTTGSIRFNLSSSNSSTSIVAAGQYSLALAVKINGTTYTDFTTAGSNNAYVEDASLGMYGLPSLTTTQNAEFLGLDTFSVSSTTCLDTAALALGDVVTVRQTVDGAKAVNAVGVDRYQSVKLFNAISNRYLSFTYSNGENTLTITQDMLDKGVLVEASADFLDAAGSSPNLDADNGLSAGSHTFGISATKADGTEVTAGCFPEAPAAPVASLSGTNISAVTTGTFAGNGDYNYFCRVYKASDNSLVLDNVYGSTGIYDPTISGYSSISCNNISGLTGGTAVYVKLFRALSLFSGWASGSAASNTVTVPTSGVTYTTTPSNGTTFGAVKALTPVEQLALSGTGTQSTSAIAEPTGGVFEFTRKGTSIAVRHIKVGGLDTAFGTATHTSTAPSYTFGSGVHGTLTAPKPFVTMMTQSMNPDLVIKDWNYDGTTGNTRTVAAADISALCVSTFGQTMSTSAQMYAVSSPTSEAYVQAKCSTTSGTYNEGWMLMKVAMTGTSAPTLVANLGTGDSTYPRFNTGGDQSGPNGLPVSINWAATGSAPVLTFVAVPMNNSCANGPCVNVYGTSKFVRIAANGSVSSTATGISSTVATGEILTINMAAVNFGTILVNRFANLCSGGPCVTTRTYFKLTATGGASAITPTWDTVSGWDNTKSAMGLALGTTADGQLVFIRSQSVSGTTSLKMAKMNLTTGAINTFGETISYTQTGIPTNVTVATGGNSFMTIASSVANAGKFDVLLGVGGGAAAPVAPTVPVPTGDADTELGKSLNAGGTKIVITGTLLTAVSGITFNEIALPSSKFVKTATKLTITVPAGTTGTVPVALVYAGGTIPVGTWEYTGATKRTQTLTPTGLGDPTHSGVLAADREFTVSSSLEDYTPAVVSKSASVCTYVSGVIDFVSNGTCVLQATQPGDAVTNAASVTYEIYYESAVDASALYSTDAGKPTITLTGEGFNSVSKVVFGGVEVTPTKKTATSITVKVPAAPSAGANVDIALKYTNGTVVETDLSFDFVGAVKLSQAVTLEAGFSLATYGDAARTLSASSATDDVAGTDLPGLPYVYTTTTKTVCAISGDQLRFLTAGTCTVIASQAGNAGVTAGSSDAFNIVVSLKDQEITVDESPLEITDIAGVNLEATNSNGEVALEYTSSDESICTVDGEGTVTGLSAGTCTVTINAPADARYSAADEKSVTLTVTVSDVDAPADATDVVEEEPIAVTSGGAGSFISLTDPSLQVSWDKAAGKLTPRATGVYTGYIVATVNFTTGGKSYTCTNVFGTTSKLANPVKPTAPAALADGATAKQIAAYAKARATYEKALAAYKVAYNKVWGTKVFATKNFCVDTFKVTGTTFGALKKVAKTSTEKKNEAAALKALKNFTGDVTITVKRWRAWPTTMKNKAGNTGTGKTISATKNVNTLTLG